MSKYPVETSDLDGVIAGVNYLLSGPAGLGQNFSGRSFAAGVQNFSGSPNGPYLFPEGSSYVLNVGPISLSSSEMLDEVTYKFTFTTPESNPPFYLGCPILISGVTDDTYNQRFSPIGVVECTTTYVIVRSDTAKTIVSSSTGGTVEFNVLIGGFVNTDCQANVTISGPTDRVFLSGQLGTSFFYNCTADTTLTVYVTIVRTQIFNKGTQTDPIYYSDGPYPVFTQSTIYDLITGDSGIKDINAIFTSFIDQDNQGVSPDKGYYNYSLQLLITSLDPTAVTIPYLYAGTRTLTAQVVKQ